MIRIMKILFYAFASGVVVGKYMEKMLTTDKGTQLKERAGEMRQKLMQNVKDRESSMMDKLLGNKKSPESTEV